MREVMSPDRVFDSETRVESRDLTFPPFLVVTSQTRWNNRSTGINAVQWRGWRTSACYRRKRDHLKAGYQDRSRALTYTYLHLRTPAKHFARIYTVRVHCTCTNSPGLRLCLLLWALIVSNPWRNNCCHYQGLGSKSGSSCFCQPLPNRWVG